MEYLRRWQIPVTQVADLEEILADPAIEAVIVASAPALRPAQLRRALQSERHVLCLHPPGDTPDLAYEAALMRQDTGAVLLPLLTEALHLAVARFQRLIHGTAPSPVLAGAAAEQITAAGPRAAVSVRPLSVVRAPRTPPACQLGTLQLLVYQRWLSGPLVDEEEDRPAGLPGWDVLRALGGEIAEVSALGPGEAVDARQPLVYAGRFLNGLLFQAALLPLRPEPWCSYLLTGSQGEVRLEFPVGWPGEARLVYRDVEGIEQVEEWPPFHPWAALVEVLERTLARRVGQTFLSADAAGVRGTSSDKIVYPTSADGPTVSWRDAVRSLELDDAVRRSVARRRASTLDFQEVTEEATFKGTMTLMGCSLLWISLMLLILSVWVPWLGWFILPVFGLFLIMQALGWVVPVKPNAEARDAKDERKSPVQ
jgi:hypothetical protein